MKSVLLKGARMGKTVEAVMNINRNATVHCVTAEQRDTLIRTAEAIGRTDIKFVLARKSK